MLLHNLYTCWEDSYLGRAIDWDWGFFMLGMHYTVIGLSLTFLLLCILLSDWGRPQMKSCCVLPLPKHPLIIGSSCNCASNPLFYFFFCLQSSNWYFFHSYNSSIAFLLMIFVSKQCEEGALKDDWQRLLTSLFVLWDIDSLPTSHISELVWPRDEPHIPLTLGPHTAKNYGP